MAQQRRMQRDRLISGLRIPIQREATSSPPQNLPVKLPPVKRHPVEIGRDPYRTKTKKLSRNSNRTFMRAKPSLVRDTPDKLQ
jgi:hypothetical protein